MRLLIRWLFFTGQGRRPLIAFSMVMDVVIDALLFRDHEVCERLFEDSTRCVFAFCGR